MTNNKYHQQEEIPIEQLLMRVCDLKQGYTQFGGQRPFGVSFLFAGWDEHHGFQLYQSDPSGLERAFFRVGVFFFCWKLLESVFGVFLP